MVAISTGASCPEVLQVADGHRLSEALRCFAATLSLQPDTAVTLPKDELVALLCGCGAMGQLGASAAAAALRQEAATAKLQAAYDGLLEAKECLRQQEERARGRLAAAEEAFQQQRQQLSLTVATLAQECSALRDRCEAEEARRRAGSQGAADAPWAPVPDLLQAALPPVLSVGGGSMTIPVPTSPVPTPQAKWNGLKQLFAEVCFPLTFLPLPVVMEDSVSLAGPSWR